LDEESHEQLFIPGGFAHGFCVLSEEARVLYKVSEIYDPKNERSFRYDDPDVGIQWPAVDLILSEKDQKAPSFKELFP
jgi:dTDP-4-dehydrorhamnose 3,5-epimerase